MTTVNCKVVFGAYEQTFALLELSQRICNQIRAIFRPTLNIYVDISNKNFAKVIQYFDYLRDTTVYFDKLASYYTPTLLPKLLFLR